MKNINVVFENEEIKFLETIKNENGQTNWHDFILDMARFYKEKKEVKES